MSSTVLLAQKATALHWTPVKTADNMSMSAVLVIDGQEIGADALQLEVGIFDQDDVCRGAKLPKLKNGRYKYSPMIYGDNTTTSYYCKVYNHATGQELELTYIPNTEDPLVWDANHTYGTSSDPYVFNFTSGEVPPQPMTLEKEITGYDDVTTNPKGNYYLIANPFNAEMTPDADNGFVTSAYDLYTFNQNGDDQGREWIAGVNTIVPGTGYLYASVTNTTLTFTGTPIDVDMFEYTLDYNDDVEFPGYNLVGNPFAQEVYVSMPFYTLDGDDYVGHDANTQVDAMAGLFVIADAEGQNVQFSTTAQTKSSNLSLNVMKNNGMVDRAIVSFNGNSQLPKFQFNSDNTKLYIPMEGKDYAVVTCEEIGELPVNFRASANGTYTLNVTSSEVSFGYLHLIDNLTGIETDLLANPSYSFEAKTTDYESRFRLVFATGNADDTFAFFSNGSLVINNDGNATLQVIDVNGRILSSESVNGCANVNVSAAPGVYMIRLINGDNVKVQKVVIK